MVTREEEPLGTSRQRPRQRGLHSQTVDSLFGHMSASASASPSLPPVCMLPEAPDTNRVLLYPLSYYTARWATTFPFQNHRLENRSLTAPVNLHTNTVCAQNIPQAHDTHDTHSIGPAPNGPFSCMPNLATALAVTPRKVRYRIVKASETAHSAVSLGWSDPYASSQPFYFNI